MQIEPAGGGRSARAVWTAGARDPRTGERVTVRPREGAQEPPQPPRHSPLPHDGAPPLAATTRPRAAAVRHADRRAAAARERLPPRARPGRRGSRASSGRPSTPSGTPAPRCCSTPGRNIKQVQAWLGHHSAAYTLSTYVHLMDDGAGDADFLDAIVADALERAAHRRRGGGRRGETEPRKQPESDEAHEAAIPRSSAETRRHWRKEPERSCGANHNPRVGGSSPSSGIMNGLQNALLGSSKVVAQAKAPKTGVGDALVGSHSAASARVTKGGAEDCPWRASSSLVRLLGAAAPRGPRGWSPKPPRARGRRRGRCGSASTSRSS